jgi:hypothetical protein
MPWELWPSRPRPRGVLRQLAGQSSRNLRFRLLASEGVGLALVELRRNGLATLVWEGGISPLPKGYTYRGRVLGPHAHKPSSLFHLPDCPEVFWDPSEAAKPGEESTSPSSR